MSLRHIAWAFAILALGFVPASAQTSTGRITGRILDAINAQPLPGVTVQVAGRPTPVVTDLDGRYVLDLPPGPHEITISLTGFQPRTVTVEVAGSAVRELDVTLTLAGFEEVVNVTGQAIDANMASMEAQLLERKRASAILDNLGSQEMKANADSSAASALQRVTGASLVGGEFVFVRGLGERYSNTSLNGALIPSTEPERKVVSLEMFPAGLLESVSIAKSYTPDRSAEFAGGMVDVIPTRLPLGPLFNASYTMGFNSLSSGQDILDHPAGDNDWLGLPNSSRGLPGFIPDSRVIRGGIFTPELGFSQEQLEEWGEQFTNEWTPGVVSGNPFQGFSVSFGGRWGGFGVSAGVNQSYRQESREESQNYYRLDGGSLTEFSTYDYVQGATSGNLSGLVNLGYNLNANHQFSAQVFTTDRGLRETRTFEGFNSDVGNNLRNARQRWLEENLRSVQFSGDHFVQGISNSRLDWRGTYSRSSRDEPDLREVLYEEIGGAFQLADESQSGLHLYNELDEDAWDFAVNWSTPFTGINGLPALFKFGPYMSARDRDFASRRFRFVPINVVRFDLTPLPEELYTPENIGPRFELREETRNTDFYTGEQRIAAGYGMIDLALSSRARIVAGARVENFRQTVDTFDLFDVDVSGSTEIIRGEIRETDIFPSVNFVQDLGSSQNLRLGFSQTVNRPEFREVSPFEFTDIVGGRATIGNPDLERTLIQNYDFRWEWFPGASQIIAASVFYKHFDKPIERFVEPTAQLRTSYTNAESARNIGFELEARREIVEHLTIGGNYTFVDSSIELAPDQLNVLTSLERPLYGTSTNLFNGMIEVAYPVVSVRLLINYFDDRIADVGSLGLPDIFEEGRATVDAVASFRFANRLTLRLAADNLTDSDVRFTQGGLDQRVYRVGRTFLVQFGYLGF